MKSNGLFFLSQNVQRLSKIVINLGDNDFVDQILFHSSSGLFKDVSHLQINLPKWEEDSFQVAFDKLIAGMPALRCLIISLDFFETLSDCNLIHIFGEKCKQLGVQFILEIRLGKIFAQNHLDPRVLLGGSVFSSLKKINECNIRFLLHYHISPDNCYFSDDVFLWMQSENISNCMFSLMPKTLFYEEFSQCEQFHIISFFDSLSHQAVIPSEKQRFYSTLVKHLANRQHDPENYLWQSNEATLLKRNGELLVYPAYQPNESKDNIFGEIDLFTVPPQKHIYFSENSTGVWNLVLEKGKSAVRVIKKTSTKVSQRFAPIPQIKNIFSAKENSPKKWENVLITGWYGTETTGDKAILGELIHVLRNYQPNVKITITTIDEKVSAQTNLEMQLAADLVHIDEAHRPGFINNMDAVIMGGGPLMEIAQIENVYKIFSEANKKKIARIIFGCGVGPIRSIKSTSLIGQICRLATAGFFRDINSQQQSQKLGGNTELMAACDPSLAFLSRWREISCSRELNDAKFVISSLLRYQTKEYAAEMKSMDFENLNLSFLENMRFALNRFLEDFPDTHLNLMPMHMYWRGNDDRIFNRRLFDALNQTKRIRLVREYLDIDTFLSKLLPTNLALAMRYHGHLFSLALGIPFFSIDYTGKKGKVANLLEEINYQEYSMSFSGINHHTLIDKLYLLRTDHAKIRAHLLAETEKKVKSLRRVYSDLWGDTQ